MIVNVTEISRGDILEVDGDPWQATEVLSQTPSARGASLLVFDEATSSLDSLTEQEVSRTIREVAGDRRVMTVLIAHRLSTVLHADRIYVLEQGRVVEQGRHDDLLAAKGLYYAMWRQQVGERRLEPAHA